MHKELLLLRHGKSDWSVDTDDFHRPLKKRGRQGARRIGTWLAGQGWHPDHVLSSPATRAQGTASRCCKAMGTPACAIHLDERIYLADPGTLLAVLAECPAQAERVLLVGHNPGLEELLELLSDSPPAVPADGKLMATATLARLSMPGGWGGLGRGSGRLLNLVRAADLP